MRKYEAPLYEIEGVETKDIILSSIQNAGQDQVGNITGIKGIMETDFGDIF